MLVVGSLATVLLAAGLIPTYLEIWKRRGRVVGISQSFVNTKVSSSVTETCPGFVFLTIDWLGAFFSLMALGMITDAP